MAKAAGKAGAKDEFISFLKELWSDVKEEIIEEVWHRLKKNLYEAQKRFSGQTVAVLGPPGAGKTTLLKVLGDPKIPSDDLRSYGKTEFEQHKSIDVDFKLSVGAGEQIRFRFKVRKNSDVGGEKYIREQFWPAVIKDAAVIIYLIDGPKLLDHDSITYRDRIMSDFDWLLDKNQMLRENFSVVLGFNKIDELCDRTGYKAYIREHSHLLKDLKLEIQDRWPDHLASHIKGGTFLSLLDPGLRAFTLNELIVCFVGDDLMKLYRPEE